MSRKVQLSCREMKRTEVTIVVLVPDVSSGTQCLQPLVGVFRGRLAELGFTAFPTRRRERGKRQNPPDFAGGFYCNFMIRELRLGGFVRLDVDLAAFVAEVDGAVRHGEDTVVLG